MKILIHPWRGHSTVNDDYLDGPVDALVERMGFEPVRNELHAAEKYEEQFDAAIFVVAHPQTFFTLRPRIRSLWTMSRVPSLLLVADAKLSNICGSLARPAVADPYPLWRLDRMYDDMVFAVYEQWYRYAPVIERMARTLCDPDRAILTHGYPWADLTRASEVMKRNRIMYYDPRPFLKPARTTRMVKRDEVPASWNLCSLYYVTDWKDGLGLSWPVRGTHRHEKKRVSSFRRKSFEHILGETMAARAELIPPHYVECAGLARWRYRYDYVLRDIGGVCAGDTAELASQCDAFSPTPTEVESMSAHSLQRLADEQREFYVSSMCDPDAEAARVKKLLLWECERQLGMIKSSRTQGDALL